MKHKITTAMVFSLIASFAQAGQVACTTCAPSPNPNRQVIYDQPLKQSELTGAGAQMAAINKEMATNNASRNTQTVKTENAASFDEYALKLSERAQNTQLYVAKANRGDGDCSPP